VRAEIRPNMPPPAHAVNPGSGTGSHIVSGIDENLLQLRKMKAEAIKAPKPDMELIQRIEKSELQLKKVRKSFE
jgi:hypothetical protein